MGGITPYIRARYPEIQGNDRAYFDAEFSKLERCLRGVLKSLSTPFSHGIVTITSGVITLTESSPSAISYVYVDTEAAAATDDLVTIDWARGLEGQILIIYPANGSRDVIIKTSGNVNMATDATLDNVADNLTVQHFSAEFYPIAGVNNGS